MHQGPVGLISIIYGVLVVCTQSIETARVCLRHYTDPAQLQAHWQDYTRFRSDIVKYTDGKVE